MSQVTCEELRQLIKQRYGQDLDEKIYRIEFDFASGQMCFFQVEDNFEYTKNTHTFELHIYDGDRPTILPFRSKETLASAFKSFAIPKQYPIAAYIDGEMVKAINPQQEKNR